MAKARADGKPVVYIGFGSITVPHPHRVTASIVKAVLQSSSPKFSLLTLIQQTCSKVMSAPLSQEVGLAG